MKLRITVEGKVYDVDVEVLDAGSPASPASPAPGQARPAEAEGAAAPAPISPQPPQPKAAGQNVLESPIAGSVISVSVSAGDSVKVNQVLIVMEAMKMETNIASPIEGKVKAVHVAAGESVRQGQPLVEFQ